MIKPKNPRNISQEFANKLSGSVGGFAKILDDRGVLVDTP